MPRKTHAGSNAWTAIVPAGFNEAAARCRGKLTSFAREGLSGRRLQ